MKLFVFGVTGDLFRRKVLKALSEIKNLEIIGLTRKNNVENKKEKLEYLKISFENEKVFCERCSKFFSKSEINYFYISLPPDKIFEAINYINDIKNEGYKVRILIEKPFGANLNEALKLKDFIEKNNLIEYVFLADHYLFKEGFLLNKNKKPKKVSIVNLESVGLEGRTFYDSIGALGDMVQSHFFNMLTFLFGESFIERTKVKELNLGQYKDYTKELGRESHTETYAKLVLKQENKEAFLETGKKFEEKISFLEIDGERFDLTAGKDPYLLMFEDFFQGKKENFPTIEMAIKNWKKIEEIKKIKTNLEIY
ncbi:MAG: hypothetical protein QXX68_01415 [Candidatus Pacearchaeota archaeon]